MYTTLIIVMIWDLFPKIFHFKNMFLQIDFHLKVFKLLMQVLPFIYGDQNNFEEIFSALKWFDPYEEHIF